MSWPNDNNGSKATTPTLKKSFIFFMLFYQRDITFFIDLRSIDQRCFVAIREHGIFTRYTSPHSIPAYRRIVRIENPLAPAIVDGEIHGLNTCPAHIQDVILIVTVWRECIRKENLSAQNVNENSHRIRSQTSERI